MSGSDSKIEMIHLISIKCNKSRFGKISISFGMISLMIFFVLNQSVFADTSTNLNTVSLIGIFQPIDVAADKEHLFVLHRTCSTPGNYQYNQGMSGTFYCPGFTAIYCNSIDFQSEILSISDSGNTNIIASIPSPFNCMQKDHIAISSGMGGFPKGYLFVSQGTWGRVNIWKISYDGKSTSLFNSSIPPLGPDVDVTFDTSGTFGYDMIITGGNQIWKIDSKGNSSPITHVPIRVHKGGSFGGAVVAPSSFGSYGGYILVPDQGTGNIFAISPQNTISKIGLWLGASEILFIPQNMCTFGKHNATFLSSHASDTDGSIVLYPKTNFENFSGGALITNQYNPSIALMTINTNGVSIKQYQSNINTQFLEGSTFVNC
jgi:hypothetical protein